LSKYDIPFSLPVPTLVAFTLVAVLAGLGAAAIQALSKYDIPFSLPVPTLVAFTLVAVLAGIGAAIMPARRASRLNVLDALHYE
jgi:putative ABC transport system permease protein